MHCAQLAFGTLRSCLVIFHESGQAHASRGVGPASAKVAHCLRSWGSQLELEMASGLSQPSSASSSTLAKDLEAHSAASSTPSKSPMLGRSSSKELDFLVKDLLPHTSLIGAPGGCVLAVAGLNIIWLVVKQEVQKRSRLRLG